jgi:hypothetical protein
MAYTELPNVKQLRTAMKERVTAGTTWAFRGVGGKIRKVVMSYTADGTVILSRKDDSAEASRIFELQVSAGANQRYVTCLEDYAGNLFVHTLTAKNLLHITYE